MKKYSLLLLLVLLTQACNRDKQAPSIILPEDSFCTVAGASIEVAMDIQEENILRELVMTAPDLDFMKSIDGSDIQAHEGLYTVGFNIDSATPDGTYILTLRAIDEFDNGRSVDVTIKIES